MIEVILNAKSTQSKNISCPLTVPNQTSNNISITEVDQELVYEVPDANCSFESREFHLGDLGLASGGRYLIQLDCRYENFPPQFIVEQYTEDQKLLYSSSSYFVDTLTTFNLVLKPKTFKLKFKLTLKRKGSLAKEINLELLDEKSEFKNFPLAMFGKVFQKTEDEKLLSIDIRKIGEEELTRAWEIISQKRPDWLQDKDLWFDFYTKRKTLQEEQIPWTCFALTRWLQDRLRPEMQIFEWGSGSSTLFFSNYVAKITSVEHEAKWFDLVNETLSKSTKHRDIDYRLVEPKALSQADDQDLHYRSGKAGCDSLCFKDYATAIRRFENNFFDLIFVDGRARVQCIEESIDKLKNGGYLVLDNSDYIRYEDSLSRIRRESMSDWQELQFAGPLPALGMIGGRATVWIKP